MLYCKGAGGVRVGLSSLTYPTFNPITTQMVSTYSKHSPGQFAA